MNKVLVNRRAAKAWGLGPQPCFAKLYIPDSHYQQIIYIDRMERIDVDKLKIEGFNIMGHQSPISTVATYTDNEIKNTLLFTDDIEPELLQLAHKYLSSQLTAISPQQSEKKIIKALKLLNAYNDLIALA